MREGGTDDPVSTARDGTMDRRTFVTGSLTLASAAAVAGALAADLATAPPAAGAHSGAHVSSSAQPLVPTTLRVNAIAGPAGPVGVDPDQLVFSWQGTSARRGARQQAYRVAVWEVPRGSSPVPASSHGTGPPAGARWDSGTVRSARQAYVEYAGPRLVPDTSYRWSVRLTDDRGVTGPWAATGVFTTGLRTSDWRAQWLRPGPAGPVPEEYAYLRTTFRAASSPIVRATAYVAAAHKYQLWCNGSLVDTGPCFAFPDQGYYQATDVTTALVAGERNALGLVHHWYGAGNGRPAAMPGALVQLSVHHADGTTETVATDGSWRELPGPWLPAPPRNNEANDFFEIIDARREPIGWATPGYDDSLWQAPTVLGPVGTAPFTTLFAQRTRIVEHPLAPVSVTTLRNGAVVADFGRIVAARPLVSFHHGVTGRTVTLHVGYVLDPDGQVSTTHATQGTDLGFTFIQRDGAQQFDPFTFLGWRYLQIDNPGEPIAADQVLARTHHAGLPGAGGTDIAAGDRAAQPTSGVRGTDEDGTAHGPSPATLPIGPDTATFESSSATLDAVWALCTHSAQYSCQEQFVDTPTRQKGQFTCDATNESQAVMRAFADRNQTWQGLRDFARSQARYWPGGQVSELYPDGTVATTIPDFSELYVEWVWRYYENTGDLPTLRTLYPVVTRIGDYVWAAVDPATGLVTNLPGGAPTYTYGIVDWPPQMRYGYDMTTAARTTVNILGVNVYARLVDMADLVGDTAGAQVHTQRHTALLAALNARLVGPGGVYIDGLNADGTQSTHASQQANALALAYGVVPAANVTAVGAHTASLGIALGPDHGLELVRGLHAAGLDATLLDLLTDASRPGWAYILAHGGTYMWESWTPSDLEQDSLSHGWGSGSLVGMHEAFLGVTITAAPATATGPTVAFAPPSGGITWARGQVPTVAGPVAVSWKRTRSSYALTLTVPPNAEASVVLPATGLRGVTESGSPVGTPNAPRIPGVTVSAFGAGKASLLVGAGSYRFRSSRR